LSLRKNSDLQTVTMRRLC